MIDGVMMRSPLVVSVAVRKPGGDLKVETWRSPSLMHARKWLGVPLLRGIIVLIETLVVGVRAILVSANAAAASDQRPLTPREMGLSMGAGLVLAVTLFFILPTLAVRALDAYFPSGLSVNITEGILRIALLIGYISLIGRVPDLRRVYQYHGAEHKTVNAFEAGVPLEVSAVRACSRFHPRCGTSFLLVVMLVVVVVFAFLDRPPLASRLLERVLLLPLVAGLSYEILRLGGRFRVFRPLALPGMWLQHLTTREPDDGQLKVAIRALREVLQAEGSAIDRSLEIGRGALAESLPQAIGVGVICKGGVVLASARLVGSSPDGPADERTSAEIHDFSFDGAKGVLTGDGEASFVIRAKDVLEEKSGVEEFHSSRDLAGMVEEAVHEIRGADRLRDPGRPRGRGRVPEPKDGRQFWLLGTYSGDGPCLYTIRSEGIARQEGFAALGNGSALAEYLLARLYRQGLAPDEAARVAVYVIEEVKKAGPAGSGPTQVVVVGREGVERKTDGEVQDIVESLKGRDDKLQAAWRVIARRPRVHRPRGTRPVTPRKGKPPEGEDTLSRDSS